MPDSEWCRYLLHPVATTLRPEDPSMGITGDMVMPIYPNEEHLRGRTPIRPEPCFPFNDCFFWIESTLEVRVRVKPEGYDEEHAVRMGRDPYMAHLKCWHDDFKRIQDNVEMSAAATPHPETSAVPIFLSLHHGTSSRCTTPSSLASSTDGQTCQPEDINRLLSDPRRTPSRESSPDTDSYELMDSMNIFGWQHDSANKFIPLVDVWLDLDQHLVADSIPSPVDLYQEQQTIKRRVVWSHIGTLYEVY